jgi:hypothetical protein
MVFLMTAGKGEGMRNMKTLAGSAILAAAGLAATPGLAGASLNTVSASAAAAQAQHPSGGFEAIRSSKPDAPLVTYHLCLNSYTTLCIVTQGQGVQVQVESSGYSNFSITSRGTWNHNALVTFTDGNGHCLREMNSLAVETGNGACSSSDTAAEWGEAGITLQNYDHTTNYMGVFSPESPKAVWSEGPQNTFYTGWRY